MEKIPEFEMVGNASEETKDQVKKTFEKRLLNHIESLDPEVKEWLKKFEIPKTELEIFLIDFVNKQSNDLMQSIGVQPYDIAPENFHIIKTEEYKYESSNAIAFNRYQGILFKAESFENNPVYFGSVALHEILHIKAFFCSEVRENNNDIKIHINPYREGVAIKSLQRHGQNDQYHEHFVGLHEAIVSEAEKRALSELFSLPELKEQIEQFESEKIQEKKKRIVKIGIPEDDIIWVDDNRSNLVGYKEQRKVLSYLCEEIQKEFPNDYKTTDDVFKEFLKAHFTGNILQIARLIEKTFGEGSFRLLGNMTTKKDSAIVHFESFKKARMRFLKKNKE